MKRTLTMVLLGIIIVAVQLSFVSVFTSEVFYPNVFFAYVFAVSILGKRDITLTNAFISGLISDLLGFGVVGLTPLLFVGYFLLADLAKKYWFKGTSFHIVSYIILYILYNQVFIRPEFFSFSFLFSLLLNLLFTTVFYLGVRRLHELQFI